MTDKERYILEHYQVTEDGKVLSNKHPKFYGEWTELKLREDKDGYLDVCLIYNDNGDRQPFRVHRLVALKYLDEVEGCDVVNHKDLDKKNNHLSNLEWGTVQSNTQHGYDNGAYSSIKKVKVVEPNGSVLVFPSQSHVSRYYGYANPSVVNAILDGRRNNPIPRGRRKGLYFEYTEEDVTTIERNVDTAINV